MMVMIGVVAVALTILIIFIITALCIGDLNSIEAAHHGTGLN
jgi:hypothetical protein